MAARVSLKRAVEVIGHSRGTHTRELVFALRALQIDCTDRLTRIRRSRPNWPARAIVAIHRPPVESEKRNGKYHWMLTWDGRMLDPGGRWPDYDKWKITSYLEIL